MKLLNFKHSISFSGDRRLAVSAGVSLFLALSFASDHFFLSLVDMLKL